MKFIVKRLIWMFPTFLGITILVFHLLSFAPHDPVDSLLALQGIDEGGQNYEEAYNKQYYNMGLNFPIFYFSIVPNYFPKSISHIASKRENQLYNDLLKERINHNLIADYITYRSSIIVGDQNSLPMLPYELRNYLVTNNQKVSQIDSFIIKMNASKNQLHYPTLRWHGLQNQYHQWMSKFLIGDFGLSIIDGRKVKDKISTALTWTSMMLIINFILTLILGVALTMYFYSRKNSFFKRPVERLLLVLYAMPVFWIGTLVVVFLTNNYFGIRLFTLGNLSSESSFWQQLIGILPITILMTLAELAYFYNLLKAGIEEEGARPYIFTAKAKGLSNTDVFKKHILRNAFIAPMTLLFASIPLAISGVLILEIVFNVPGMGRLMYNSIVNADHNVVYSIVCIISFLTLIFSLISDVAYALINPKIRFATKN